MRDYIKPIIVDEEIELEDIIAVSGPTNDPLDLIKDEPEGGDL